MQLSFWTDAESDYEDPIGKRRRFWVALLVAALAGFFGSGLWGPGITLGREQQGDETLAAKTIAHLRSGAGYDTMSVVEIDRDGAREVRHGDDQGEHWELGGLTETFTGHVLADAVERSEVTLDDPLERHLPELAGSPVGAVTLGDLATHHGGVPGVVPGQGVRLALAPLTLRDPYRSSTGELLSQARQLTLGGQGAYAHSDIGAALLGHAVARATGQPDWPSAVRVRLLGPLGMADTVFAATTDQAPGGAVQGHRPNGRKPGPWLAEGMVPAGVGGWTTTADLTRYAQALLAGTAPGMAALEPQAQVGAAGRIGATWLISPGPEDRTLTWHNGRTGGGSSIVLLDRATGRAVIAVNNSATSVDALGAGLIGDAETPPRSPGIVEVIAVVVLLLAAVWIIRRSLRATRRTQLIEAGVDLLAIALLTAILGDWVSAPGWMHGIGWGLGLGGLLLGVRRARSLPWWGPSPRADKIQLAISGAALLLVLGLIVV
ncbi:MAG: serine hydrolase domain-containing protein [Propionibacteriaceae bacterium]|nr:serine hydrolase domain-containing protein [Propionibacteriaceae bacterium]